MRICVQSESFSAPALSQYPSVSELVDAVSTLGTVSKGSRI